MVCHGAGGAARSSGLRVNIGDAVSDDTAEAGPGLLNGLPSFFCCCDQCRRGRPPLSALLVLFQVFLRPGVFCLSSSLKVGNIDDFREFGDRNRSGVERCALSLGEEGRCDFASAAPA